MQEHSWIQEEIDGGHLGIGRFWKCWECGASGGPVIGKKGYTGFRSNPFLGNGSGLQLSTDCDLSKQLVKAFELGVEYGELKQKVKRKKR